MTSAERQGLKRKAESAHPRVDESQLEKRMKENAPATLSSPSQYAHPPPTLNAKRSKALGDNPPAQDQSPFLKLPGELRNQIYELVLGNTRFYTYYFRGTKRYEVRGFDSATPWGEAIGERLHNFLSLVGVCRQIYHETALLPFSLKSNSFIELRSPFLREDTLRLAPLFSDWSTCLSDNQLGAIRSIDIRLDTIVRIGNVLSDEVSEEVPSFASALRKLVGLKNVVLLSGFDWDIEDEEDWELAVKTIIRCMGRGNLDVILEGSCGDVVRLKEGNRITVNKIKNGHVV